MADPISFSAKDKVNCTIQQSNISLDNWDDSKLPTDTHLVNYTIGDESFIDAVRAYSMVDIHDAYYDKLKGIGTIHSIKSGYGRIKPKLYGYQPPKDNESDRPPGSKGLFA